MTYIMGVSYTGAGHRSATIRRTTMIHNVTVNQSGTRRVINGTNFMWMAIVADTTTRNSKCEDIYIGHLMNNTNHTQNWRWSSECHATPSPLVIHYKTKLIKRFIDSSSTMNESWNKKNLYFIVMSLIVLTESNRNVRCMGTNDSSHTIVWFMVSFQIPSIFANVSYHSSFYKSLL